MTKILSFEKPQKVRSTKEHNETYSSDSGVAGTYVPNMTEEDMKKWKAKHIKGDDERIEIRKTFEGVQVLAVVYKNPKDVSWENKKSINDWYSRHKDIRISMNGKLNLSYDDWFDMQEAIKEAFEIML